jgi:secreted PhoX family phosphatase
MIIPPAGASLTLDADQVVRTSGARIVLARFGYEEATFVQSRHGHAVLYLGDDGCSEYLYRFVSKKPVGASDPRVSRSALDEGRLSAARFDSNGTLTWLPLRSTRSLLNQPSRFEHRGEFAESVRLRAEKAGATPMGVSKSIETISDTGWVYLVLGSCASRQRDDTRSAGQWPEFMGGYIVELIPPAEGGAADHTADVYKWDVLTASGGVSRPRITAEFMVRARSRSQRMAGRREVALVSDML